MLVRKCLQALFISISFLSTANAKRCGEKLVYAGDSEFDVFSKCGEPLNKQIYDQPVPQYNTYGYQIGVINNSVSKWIYQKSPAEFQYELIFDAGVLKEINANRNP